MRASGAGPTRVKHALVALVAVMFAVLAYQVVRRIVFPWDLFIWAESPFMTNMMKLATANGAFDAPSDASSWVYSPGLEYVCFALLRPVGLHLDVRACRAVNVVLGIGGSFFAAKCSSMLLALLDGDRREASRPRIFGWFAFGLIALVTFRSFTADVCHPDNLFIAHAMLGLYLCLRAVTSCSYRLAILAVAWSALGVLTKQTAAFGVVGVSILFLFVHRDRWSLAPRALLPAVGAVVAAAAGGLLLSSESSRFHLVAVLAHHAVHWDRLLEIMRIGSYYPHVTVLVVAAIVALTQLLGMRRPGVFTFLACWLALGAEVVPALGSFLKQMGQWNNLTIVEVWLAVPTLPAFWIAIKRPSASLSAALPAATLVLLTLLLVPLKARPTAEQWRFGETLDRLVAEDVRAGRRVLLPHGTTPLLRAGIREAPLDRANSFLELRQAQVDALAGTRERIEHRHYDAIYLFVSDYYGQEIADAIERNYREVQLVRGVDTPIRHDYVAAEWDYMAADVRVMRPR